MAKNTAKKIEVEAASFTGDVKNYAQPDLVGRPGCLRQSRQGRRRLLQESWFPKAKPLRSRARNWCPAQVESATSKVNSKVESFKERFQARTGGSLKQG